MRIDHSVKLGIIKEILDRAGLKPVNRQEIVHVKEIKSWTDEELKARMGEAKGNALTV